MHARHIQLIYYCFFSSLNKLPSYSRTTHLASSHLPGTRTRRSLQRSGRSCQLDSRSLGSPARKHPCRCIYLLLPPRLQCGMWKYGAVNPILLPELRTWLRLSTHAFARAETRQVGIHTSTFLIPRFHAKILDFPSGIMMKLKRGSGS